VVSPRVPALLFMPQLFFERMAIKKSLHQQNVQRRAGRISGQIRYPSGKVTGAFGAGGLENFPTRFFQRVYFLLAPVGVFRQGRSTATSHNIYLCASVEFRNSGMMVSVLAVRVTSASFPEGAH